MYKVNVNGKFDHDIEKAGDDLLINGSKISADIKQLSTNTWHIIEQLRSYNVEVVSFDKELKTAQVRVNNNTYSVTAKDQFDLLLDKMGLSGLTAAKIAELKAPMPGLVLKIFVEDGATVKKGDSLVILEAMKMENIIRSPVDTEVRSIKIKPGDKVEKGQILLQFA